MKPKAIYLLAGHAYEKIYGPHERRDLAERLEFTNAEQTQEIVPGSFGVLNEVEVILSGWGGPRMDAEFLAQAPKLKLVLYGAGSVKGIVSDAFWERGVRICSAWGANAIPVAEYTLAQILFCLKRGWFFAREVKKNRAFGKGAPVAGAYGSTVGLVSLGMIGRLVCEHLKRFEMKVIAYDPFVRQEDAAALGVELRSLEEVFCESDVVSVHTPWLKETEKLITGEMIGSMKEGAALINSSRGAVIDEPAMVEVLAKRPDLQAVLDVTYPEPPPPESALYDLDNVVLTPHIAGSMDTECRRMGRFMVQELDRYLAGEPLRWEVTREKAAVMA